MACARGAACSRVMGAASVDEPDVFAANGRRETVFFAVGRRAGVRRYGRRYSSSLADELASDELVANGRRAGNATLLFGAGFPWFVRQGAVANGRGFVGAVRQGAVRLGSVANGRRCVLVRLRKRRRNGCSLLPCDGCDSLGHADGIGANVRHCPLPRRPRRGERLRSLRGEVSLEGLKDLMFAPSEELSPIVLVEEALRETRCIVHEPK